MAIKDLDRLSILNIEYDLYTKDFWIEKYGEDQPPNRYFQYNIPIGMWKVSFLGTRIVKDLKECLRENIEGGKAAEYWVLNRKRFSPSSFFKVDWESNQKEISSVSLARWHCVTKFESGICGTGRMMKMWKQRVIDNYPRCCAPNETTTHILRCPCDAAKGIWESSLVSLEEWLKENKTCPDLRRLLLHMINRWRLGIEVTNLVDFEFDWK